MFSQIFHQIKCFPPITTHTHKKKNKKKNKNKKPLKNLLDAMSIFLLIHAMKPREINEIQIIPRPSSETMVTQNLLFGQS